MRGRSPSGTAAIEQGGFSFGTAFRSVDITRATTVAALFFTAVKVLFVRQMVNKPLPCFAFAVKQRRYGIFGRVFARGRPFEYGVFLAVVGQFVAGINQSAVIFVCWVFRKRTFVRLGPFISVLACLVADLLGVNGWIFAPRIRQLGGVARANGVMVCKSRHSAPPCCSP